MARDGASFLLGLLGEARQRREAGQESQSRIQELLAGQAAKQMFPDPLTAFLSSQLSRAQTQGGQGGGQGGNASPLVAGLPLTSLHVKGMGFGSQAGVTPQSDVDSFVQGVTEGTVPPDPNQVSYRDRTRVNAAFARRGTDLSKLQADWLAIKQTIKSSNSTQQLRMRQALESVRQSLPLLRQASEGFDRLGFRPVTWAQLTAAMTGADPSKRSAATKFVTQINVMQDELAQGFMGGGVPTDRAFQLARDVLSPLYGEQQLGSALEQLETNVGVRLHAIQSTPPITLGGAIAPNLSRFGGSLSTGQPEPTGGQQTFSSEEEAESASLPPGTVVTINGRRARIR